MTKLIAFGDSIFAGWNGKSQDSNDQRIPELIGQALGWEVTNTAISGAQFDDRDSGFPNMARTHSVAGYDYAIVNFGVNNWCFPSGGVDYATRKASEGIDALKAENPNIKILLELPTEDFRNGSTTLFDLNSQGWTQNQLDDELISVAKAEGIDYYDWRSNPIIAYANANEKLGDGNTGVHPTPATSREIADRLVAKFKQMIAQSKPSEPDNPHPYQPVVNILNLAELTDVFKLGDNLTNNVAATISFVNSLYDRIGNIYGMLDSKKIEMPVKFDKPLQRALRNEVIKSFLELNTYLNELIRYCKKEGIMNYETGEYAPAIELTLPRLLAIDENYQKIINNNWKLIEDTLNQISNDLQEMEE